MTTGNILSTASQGHKKLMAMTYFQNIHSLADLKKEYRRLALQHHPDKGGDTAIMQRVNTEFERLFEAWKDKPDVFATSTGYEYDYPGATAKEYTEYVYNEYRWKGFQNHCLLRFRDLWFFLDQFKHSLSTCDRILKFRYDT